MFAIVLAIQLPFICNILFFLFVLSYLNGKKKNAPPAMQLGESLAILYVYNSYNHAKTLTFLKPWLIRHYYTLDSYCYITRSVYEKQENPIILVLLEMADLTLIRPACAS